MLSSMSQAGSVGGPKLNGNQESNNTDIMTMSSGLVASPQVNHNGVVVRGDSELNSIGATSISPTANIDAIPSSNTSGDISNLAKQETGSSTLNVNSILNDADNAAIAAQTITLAPGKMTANSNLINNSNIIPGPAAAAAAAAASNAVGDASNSGTKANINNLSQYVLPNTAIQGLPTNTPAPAFHNAPVPVAATTPTAPVDPNNANAATHHLQSAILQQNAAIMQQNAATLQHLQTLHQTNKLLATNPETLGMSAPIMSMTNPVQLLAPGLNLNPNGTFLPMANLAEMNGGLAAAAPIGTQLQQQQLQAIPIPAPAIAIAPGAPEAFPVVANNGVLNNALDANNNDAVQNFLRTAFILQNGGLPFGMIPQQQQQQQALLSAPAAPGNLMLVPNAASAAAPFGIVPATVESDKSKGDVANGAAAAANAAASVLPPASMNLPLQQQLQQQQLNAVPQVGIDLNSNNNNAIALLNGTTLNAANNGLPIAGLATLQQQQQQQRIPAMVFPGMNLEGHLTLPLMAPTPQQNQQLVVSNPAANSIPQAQPMPKKSTTISRPLYLDHDSNCEFLVVASVLFRNSAIYWFHRFLLQFFSRKLTLSFLKLSNSRFDGIPVLFAKTNRAF